MKRLHLECFNNEKKLFLMNLHEMNKDFIYSVFLQWFKEVATILNFAIFKQVLICSN